MQQSTVQKGVYLSTLHKEWVLKNVQTFSALESMLRTVLFFMPATFRQSEIKLEFAYSVIGLLSLHHDSVVMRHIRQKLERRFRAPIQKYATLSSTQSNTSTLSREEEDHIREMIPSEKDEGIVIFLSVLRYTELFLEIFSRDKFGERGSWIAIFIIESIKALCKTKLLFNNRGRVVTHHYVPLYKEYPPINELLEISPSDSSPGVQREDSTKGERRSRRSVSPAKWKQFKIFTDPDGPVKIQPHYAAELLHIFRPLIYLAGMYWWGKKSWKAWLVSLFADITSLRHYAKNVRMLTPAETDEMTRRATLLLFYLLRSPFFEKITVESPAWVQAIVNKLRSIPMMNTVIGALKDCITVYRERYFYISGT